MTVDLSPKRAAMATVMMLSCCAALAGEPADKADATDDGAPRWTFGGFGTLGVAHSDSDQADYISNVLTPGAVGYSKQWSATVDSRAGAQLEVHIDSAWSAVLQLVSERSLLNGYAPSVEWANIRYQFTPDLNLRFGRIALPLFLASDYRKAGYALPWVRPSVELYDAIPLSNSDGIDASYRWEAGGFNNVTQVFFGRTDIPVAADARAKARALAGLSNTTTSGALTLRTSVLTTDLTVDLASPLFDGLRQFGPTGEALAARYGLSVKRAYAVSIGAIYDPGQWFAMGEIGHVDAHSYLGKKTAGYVSAGYRYHDLTPYLAYSASRPNMETAVAGLDLRGMPLQQAAFGAQLNAGLNQMLAAIPRQHTISAGVRWDFRCNYALKLQYDRVTAQQGSTGAFVNVQPGFQPGRPVTVLSAAVDFVF